MADTAGYDRVGESSFFVLPLAFVYEIENRNLFATNTSENVPQVLEFLVGEFD